MKITCLGGGGWYFTRPISEFVSCEDIHGSEIALYDIDRDRAELTAKMGRRLSREAGRSPDEETDLALVLTEFPDTDGQEIYFRLSQPDVAIRDELVGAAGNNE